MHGDFTGRVGSMARLGLSTCRCVYMYDAVMIGLYFNTRCHMHLEGALKCMVTLRGELAACFGLALLGFCGLGVLRRRDTGDRMHLDGI